MVIGGEVAITDEEERAALVDGTSENAVDGVNYDRSEVNTSLNWS